MSRATSWPVLLAVAVLGAAAAWLAVGTGFANYDTAYSLVWGNDLAHGRAPDYEVTLAPTPHPLAILGGLVVSPLGDGAETAAVIGAYAALGAVTALTYALGALWFGWPAGALAAAIVITREPVLSFGVRAYVDLPYLALVLAALLAEARRPRAGAPVLVLLGLAGLLRPEAWLFAAAYVAYLAVEAGPPGARRRLTWARDRRPRDLAALAALAAAAPVIWALTDLVVTGDPLHSLTGTRAGAETLERRRGLVQVPLTGPRRIGEILREPVLLGVVLGGPLVLLFLRERVRLLLAAGLMALAAFCVLAVAGLPILGRYLLLLAVLLAIVCGAAVFGWRLLPDRHPWRARWIAAGVLVLAALAVFTPRQVERLRDLRGALQIQREIRDDLHALARGRAMRAGCPPVAVPNHRPVPLLALWLDLPPRAIVSAQLERPRAGLYVDPATARVERNFTLDPNDPRRLTARVPPGFERVDANSSWVLYERCP